MIRDVAMSESHNAIIPQLQVYGIFILIYFLKKAKKDLAIKSAVGSVY